MKPLIAIPMDYLDTEKEPDAKWYSTYSWYAVRYRYHETLVKMGAIPCFIGYSYELIPEYTERFSGLIIAGGHFDHDPELYNQEATSFIKRRSSRSQFEMALLKSFLPTKKPILGICGGHQLINISYGGTLFQDINTMHKNAIKHSGTCPPTQAAHPVNLVKNTKLSLMHTELSANVNSSHHQAIDQLGKGLIVNALAEDGIIEGIEDPNHPFCLGIQWHPEYQLNPLDVALMNQFVKACA